MWNRTARAMELQLQFHLERMGGVVVAGVAFRSLGRMSPGASATCEVTLLPVAAGLHALRGCVVVDMQSAQEFAQPSLGDVLVDAPDAPLSDVPLL